jgi:hypothetical protein
MPSTIAIQTDTPNPMDGRIRKERKASPARGFLGMTGSHFMHPKKLTTTVATLFVAVELFTGCGRSPGTQSPTTEAEPAHSPASAAPQPAAAAIAAAPAVATPAPVPVAQAPAPELAPPGVFYLVEAYKVETDAGITGLPPGTGVKLLHDNVYLTPAGEAKLPPGILTNDMAAAREARDADRQAQTVAQQSIAAQNAAAAQHARLVDSATPRSGGGPGVTTDLQRAHDAHSFTNSWEARRYYYDAYGHVHYY